MTKEELREHCEKQVKMCEEWAKGNNREPSGKIYEEHKLILDLINELQDKSYELWKESYEEEHLRNIRLEEKIKALEQDNEEIFKQFKKKVFLESEDVLGNEMVDSYMITDYLAELLGGRK